MCHLLSNQHSSKDSLAMRNEAIQTVYWVVMVWVIELLNERVFEILTNDSLIVPKL